jgi:trimeric autotransporter adhesin
MKFIITTLLFLAAVISHAQDQITSFKTGASSGLGVSRIVDFRDELLFVLSDEQRGAELWISDGTAAGTRLVKDINLGRATSLIDKFVNFKDQVYFTADDGLDGMQLWVTDGTTAGTRSVTSEVSGIKGPIITDGDLMYFLRVVNSKLEVWKSDGTVSGTTLIKADIGIVSGPSNFSLIGDLLYFTVGVQNNSSEVWRSDGTASGTFAISNALDGIGADPGGSFHPSHFVEFNGDLYFIARSGFFSAGSSGLVKATGNTGETTAIKSFHDGSIARYGEAFKHNDKMYFTFFQVTEHRFFIVESDGTTENTTIIFDETYPANFSPSRVLVDGNDFYFTVATGDGGTSLVKFDVTNRSTGDVIGSVGEPYERIPVFIPQYDVTTMFRMGEGIFIIAKNGQTLGELWHLDIPSETLKQLGYMHAGNDPAVFKEKFYYNGTATAAPQRFGFWQSDGATEGTKALIDGPVNDRGLSTSELFYFNDNALFVNRDGEHGQELWVTDGSAGGTHLLVDVLPGAGSSSPQPLFELNGSFIFLAYGTDGQLQLYKTDGTPQGTSSFTSIADYPGDYRAAKRDNTSFFFSAKNRAPDKKPNFLYISDGTIAGTKTLKDLGANTNGVAATVTDIVVAGGRAVFSTQLDKSTLWTSDGTEDGTIKIADFSTINELVVVNNAVYFTDETELYRTDGTTAGTTMVKDLNGSGFAAPKDLVPFNNRLIFAAVGGDTGRELWITDGTADGTRLVRDIVPGNEDAIFKPQTAVLGDNFYFTADDPEHGSELWMSDGSTEGTILLKDIVHGSDESRPGKFKVVGDEIYFQAFTPEHGYEVWVSDGTAANTKLMFDLLEGPPYSNPEGFIGVNNSIIFFGLTRTDGNQLWSYEKAEETITGIEEVQESDLNIFPNPSSGSCYVRLYNESLTNANLEVLALDGRLVNFSFSNEEGKLNLHHVSPGIYIVKIRMNSKTFTKKVVKF